MKKIILCIGIILACALVLGISLTIFYVTNTKYYYDEGFNIETYKSSVDKDQDGIDDQTDILDNVRKYIATKPKYKSKYYSTGYPNDEYGVCVDVVAFGLKDAGYDLMELVNEDIVNNKEEYHIDNVDKKIDFRRVKNLRVFFKKYAVNLTLDLKDIADWQGGDIVVFEKHVGIISDKRNKRGVPLVIHHYSIFQKSYEEDILEYRNDIVGHYRMS